MLHPRRARRGAVAAATALLLLLTTAVTASAHAVQQFGGYTIAIGWLHEPTYVDQENAVQVVVKDSHGDPVNDLQLGDLSVTVATGGQVSSSMQLQPSYDPDTGLGTPGEYDAAIIPTAVGDYTFHLTGSIHGTAVDKSFTSGPQTFDTVKAPSDAQFPTKLPAIGDISTKVDRVAARAADAQSASDSASGDAGRATVLAIAALVVAVVALVVAVVLTRRRRVA